jgi:hypothetical protein
VRCGPLPSVVEGPPGDRDRLLGGAQVGGPAVTAGDLAGEVLALGDGGDVSAVVGEDLFEDVPDMLGPVGDDKQLVVLSAAGGSDVDAAVAGGRSKHTEADIDCVAFVAVAGGGVAEPHVRLRVVGRQGYLAVSVAVGHGEADVEDGP